MIKTTCTAKRPIGRFQIEAKKDIKKGEEIKINWCLSSTPNSMNEKNPFLSFEYMLNPLKLMVFRCDICDFLSWNQMEYYMHMSGQKSKKSSFYSIPSEKRK